MKKNIQKKLAIIGLGYWGPNFARACIEHENIALTYCCDVDIRGLSRIKRRFPSVKTTTDYHTILTNAAISGVIVVTPPATHFPIVKDCLLAGKDVLVEKPITLKVAHAENLIRLAKEKGRILMVDHIFQFNPAIQKLREVIKTRKLGKIFYISCSYTALGPVRTDVNSLWDLAPHLFYTVEHLLHKKALWVSTVGQSYLKKGTEDVSYVTLGFPGDILAVLHVSWLYPYKVRSVVVVGSKKMAVFDDTATDQKLKIYDKGAYYDTQHPDYPSMLKVVYREGDVVIPKIDVGEPLTQVLQAFIAGMDKRVLDQSDGEAGKRVVCMLEAAAQSLMKKGKRIHINASYMH